MKNNKIENRIKKGFEQKNSQFNKFELWQEIEKELPEEKKDRRFFFWFFFAGLIIGASIIGIYFLDNTKKESVAATTTAGSSLDDQALVIASDTKKTVEKRVEEKDVVLEEGELNVDLSNRSAQNKLQQLELEKSTKNNNSVANDFSNSSNSAFLKSKNNKTINPFIQYNTPLRTSKKEEEKALSKVKSSIVEVPPLPMKSFPIQLLSSDTIELALGDFSNFKAMETIISPVPFQSKWSIAATGNYLLLNRTLTGANQDWVDQKIDSETLFYGASADIMVRYQVLPRLGVGVGLDYTRIEEKIEWSGQGASIKDVQSDSASYFEYFEQAFYIPGTTKQTTTFTRSLRNYNKIEQWSIPIELTYSPVQGKRFSIDILGGFQYNFSSKMNGKFLGNGNVILEEADIYSIYKKNVHTWYSGIELAFHPSRKLSIITELKYQSSQNFLQSSTNTNLKYEGYAIGLGLRRNF